MKLHVIIGYQQTSEKSNRLFLRIVDQITYSVTDQQFQPLLEEVCELDITIT
jgi:hypothetical protein